MSTTTAKKSRPKYQVIVGFRTGGHFTFDCETLRDARSWVKKMQQDQANWDKHDMNHIARYSRLVILARKNGLPHTVITEVAL